MSQYFPTRFHTSAAGLFTVISIGMDTYVGWAATTLAGGTCSACRYRSTILGCAFGCLDLFATLVIALELVAVVVEVVAAFENNGGLMLGLFWCGSRGTLGAFGTGTTIAIAITAAALAAVRTLATLTAVGTLRTLTAAGGLGSRWETELLALFAEDSLAGELDAVALDGEYLDQDLITLVPPH